MIERCTFCGNTHETGDPNETFFGGMRMRICPEVPDPPGFIIFNPRDWFVWPRDTNFHLNSELDLNIATVAAAPRPTLSRPGILDTAKPPIL